MGTSSWRGIVTACVLLGMVLVMVFTRLGRGGSAESVDACTLACAHVAACGGFAAINGSSVATAATMTRRTTRMRASGEDEGERSAAARP